MTDAPLLPRTHLFGNPERAMPRLSADGRWLAFLMPVNGVLEAWVAPSHAPLDARVVTQQGGRGVQNLGWAGDRVVFAKDDGGDENWHLWSAAPDGSDLRDLTPLPGVAATLVAQGVADPGRLLVGLNDRDPRHHDLWAIDARTGARSLVRHSQGEAAFVADGDLVPRASAVMGPDGGLQWSLLDDAGAQRPWRVVPPQDALTTHVLRIEGRTAWWLDATGRDKAALVEEDLDTGRRVTLAEADEADIADVWCHPVSGRPQLAFAEAERRRTIPLDADAATDLQRATASLGDADLHLVSRSQDDRIWLLTEERADGPLRHWRLERSTGQLDMLFDSRPWLRSARLAPMSTFTIPARDGLPLVCYLTLPPGQHGPLPLVINVHGGPWARDRWGYDPEAQLYANRGYATVSVNFRGSTGFGKRFVNAGDHEWAGRMHDDLLDVADHLVRTGVADADRTAVVGGSYGGYAALVAVSFTPERFAAAVSMVGPSDLRTLLASIPPYWAPMRALFATRVGDDATPEGRALLWERSPLRLADRIRRPLLIAQGANDPRVKQQESEQIVAALAAAGIPCTYALFPDEGHGFARPENRMAFYALTEQFLARHLGGRAEPGLPDGSSLVLTAT